MMSHLNFLTCVNNPEIPVFPSFALLFYCQLPFPDHEDMQHLIITMYLLETSFVLLLLQAASLC